MRASANCNRPYLVVPKPAPALSRGAQALHAPTTNPERRNIIAAPLIGWSDQPASPYPEPPSSANSFRSLYMPYPMMNREIDAM